MKRKFVSKEGEDVKNLFRRQTDVLKFAKVKTSAGKSGGEVGFAMALGHSAVGPDSERFTEGLLEGFAKSLPGKSLVVGNVKVGVFHGGSTMKMSPGEFQRAFGEEPVLAVDAETVTVLFGNFNVLKGQVDKVELGHVEMRFAAHDAARVLQDGIFLYTEYTGPGCVNEVFLDEAKAGAKFSLVPREKTPVRHYRNLSQEQKNPLIPSGEVRRSSTNPLVPSLRAIRKVSNPLIPAFRG